MQSEVLAAAPEAVPRHSSNTRGEYGTPAVRQGTGSGSVVLVLGLTAAIYALSPGARYWYKHGRLPLG